MATLITTTKDGKINIYNNIAYTPDHSKDFLKRWCIPASILYPVKQATLVDNNGQSHILKASKGEPLTVAVYATVGDDPKLKRMKASARKFAEAVAALYGS